MKSNSRLALALHTLSHMASNPSKIRTSADIAEHAGTNPVVVRRVLGSLRKAGLLISEKGHAGGWILAKSPETISVADVYLALDERLVINGNASQAQNCTTAKNLHNKVANMLDQTETFLIEKMKTTQITELRAH